MDTLSSAVFRLNIIVFLADYNRLMQNLGIIIWAIALMIVLNVLVVVITIGVKALRSVGRRRIASETTKIEAALEESLASGEVHPDLLRLRGREWDILATLMVEYLSVLRGAERDRLTALARETGLVDHYSRRLVARGRWRKARAAENLGYFGGPEEAPLLVDLLSHPDETLRAVAARALARIGTPESVKALANTLDSPSELTRLRMAENLERVGHPAVGPLIRVLEQARSAGGDWLPGPVQAARVLGQLRASEAREALGHAALEGESVDLRAKAALALGKVGDPEDVPKLLEAAEDEAWPVRAQAASALGLIGDVSAIPKLQELTVDREWWVRLNASRALANMGPAGERALARLLEDADRYARDRAAATLEERGITRRAVEELTLPGERGASARAMIQGMVKAGAVKYLERLARTLPEEATRLALKETMVEARDGTRGGAHGGAHGEAHGARP